MGLHAGATGARGNDTGECMATRKRTRKTGPVPPLTFPVTDESGTVTITARHVKYHVLAGMEAALVGESKDEADPTGVKYLRERIIKLGKVTTAIDTGDPDDEDLKACAGDFEKFYNLEGNENLAWLGWAEYLRALDGALSKSGATDRSDGDGESGGAAEPDAPAVPQMRAV